MSGLIQVLGFKSIQIDDCINPRGERNFFELLFTNFWWEKPTCTLCRKPQWSQIRTKVEQNQDGVDTWQVTPDAICGYTYSDSKVFGFKTGPKEDKRTRIQMITWQIRSVDPRYYELFTCIRFYSNYNSILILEGTK